MQRESSAQNPWVGHLDRKFQKGTDVASRNQQGLDLTISFDHDIVDGAPAARLVKALREEIESASALREATESH